METNPSDVFINCPFDESFADGFRALVFAVIACGFTVRCAREDDDGSEMRIDKLYRIIEESRYSIHDLSYVAIDPVTKLPRFNMPFELGLFLAAKRYGSDGQRLKKCLVHDRDGYRYRQSISDLSGIDVTAHGDDPTRMAGNVRDFLKTAAKRQTIPSRAVVLKSYDRFTRALPKIVSRSKINLVHLGFVDFEALVIAWVESDQSLAV
jgi:hypothetical protein